MGEEATRESKARADLPSEGLEELLSLRVARDVSVHTVAGVVVGDESG